MARHIRELVGKGEVADAIECVERALAVDALVEDFYCEQMRCYARLGQLSAVVDVYARMQLVLRKGLARAQVERAIKLSKEKYCSATIMLAATAAITFDYELREA